MNRLIIGVGTGRCGTKSLTKLLEVQDDTYASHERFGPKVRWNCPPNLWPLRLWRDTKRNEHSVVAEIALYWTSQIGNFLRFADRDEREVRIVGLKRDREETIESYKKWRPEVDHWSFHGYRDTKPDDWDHCFPCYDTDSKHEGIGFFWDEVYETIHHWEKKDERVKCFCTKDLNSKGEVRAILEHCGFSSPNMKEKIHLNRGP